MTKEKTIAEYLNEAASTTALLEESVGSYPIDTRIKLHVAFVNIILVVLHEARLRRDVLVEQRDACRGSVAPIGSSQEVVATT